MTDTLWQDLLKATAALMRDAPDLAGFCALGDDLQRTPVEFADHPARLAFEVEDFGTTHLSTITGAVQRAGTIAHWRLTYGDTDIGQDFLDRFGCYCLIGPNAPWISKKMAAFFVYMPAGLWYPWHAHPAEEMYFVLAGQGRFLREGLPDETLGPGKAAFHASRQPHALLTTDQPILALVLWRNELETPPELVPNLPRPE